MANEIITDKSIEELGLKEQKNIASLSDIIFNSAVSGKKDKVIDTLKDITSYLERLSESKGKMRKGLFGLKKDTVLIKQEYRAVRQKINYVTEELKNYKLILLKNAEMYEQYDKMNREYISGLERCMSEGRKLRDGLEGDELERLSARLDNLQTTLQVSNQLSAQIKLLVTQDKILLSNIQDILINTISLWQNQVMILLERNKGLHDLELKNDILKERFNAIIKEFQR